jgi:hypothetical protein
LVAFLDAGTPPVYVGFGSMPMRASKDVARGPGDLANPGSTDFACLGFAKCNTAVDLINDGLCGRLIEIRRDDLHAFLGKAEGGGAADVPGAAPATMATCPEVPSSSSPRLLSVSISVLWRIWWSGSLRSTTW